VAAIIFLLVTLTLSVTITRIGTVALTLTGMSRDSAHFQARSAFYGVGFTTAEAESVVNHPVRRQIVILLMVLGNLGIATMVAGVIVSFTMTSSSGRWGENLMVLLGSLAALWVLSRSRWLSRTMSRLVTAALRSWPNLDVHDYVALLQLSSGYTVLEIRVQPGDWLAGMTLAELNLSREGVLVLGIYRANKFVGAPTGQTRIDAHDTVVVYGPMRRLKKLEPRAARTGYVPRPMGLNRPSRVPADGSS
jgi:hypothetical protein